METKERKQLSLRWKWAIILSGAFITLYIIISAIMILLLKNNQLQSERLVVDQTSQNIMAILRSEQSRVSVVSDYEPLFNFEKANSSYSYMYATLQRDGVIGRIIDNDGRVVYETASLEDIPIHTSHTNRKESVQYHNKDAILVTDVLVNAQRHKIGTIQLLYTLTSYHRRMQSMDKNYMVVSVSSVVLCTILGFLIAHYFFMPIQHMTQIMSSLREDAETKHRMDLSKRRSDELADLSVGFNDLLDTMDLYINQQKQFVEDVSHELRTPVAIVEGHLKMLNRWGKNDPQVLEESLEASLHEIGRMKTLVQEMLDLSRAEQVGIHYRNEVTEVLSLLYQIHQNFVIMNENFHFNLEIDCDKQEQIYVQISRHHLEQILIILIDNAVKYSTDKPYIHISFSKTVNHIQISVQDFGEGISETDLLKVFGRFYRVDKARSRHKGGNGLGLSIAKELVEGYKGTIHAESVVNNGSTFRVEFPIVTDVAKIAQSKKAANQIKGE